MLSMRTTLAASLGSIRGLYHGAEVNTLQDLIRSPAPVRVPAKSLPGVLQREGSAPSFPSNASTAGSLDLRQAPRALLASRSPSEIDRAKGVRVGVPSPEKPLLAPE